MHDGNEILVCMLNDADELKVLFSSQILFVCSMVSLTLSYTVYGVFVTSSIMPIKTTELYFFISAGLLHCMTGDKPHVRSWYFALQESRGWGGEEGSYWIYLGVSVQVYA